MLGSLLRLSAFMVQLGMRFDVSRSESTVLHVLPFNSHKKRGGVAIKRVFLSQSMLPFVLGNLCVVPAPYIFSDIRDPEMLAG